MNLWSLFRIQNRDLLKLVRARFPEGTDLPGLEAFIKESAHPQLVADKIAELYSRVYLVKPQDESISRYAFCESCGFRNVWHMIWPTNPGAKRFDYQTGERIFSRHWACFNSKCPHSPEFTRGQG